MTEKKENDRIKIALDSLGCKLNQAEMELLGRRFAAAGYDVVAPGEGADVYILNTCTVTRMADSKSRQRLRAAHRRSPDILVVATGCYAQRAPEELSRIDGVGLVAGNDDKANLVRLVEDAGYPPAPEMPSEAAFRTRAMIKIQDGCDNRCAYCIVPLVRGGGRSLSPARVLAEVNGRVREGYKEVVLTGVEIGSYSSDGLDLKGLLEHVLDETDVARIRLSSLQPPEISPGFIGLWRDPRLCPHFHLSLQSGSDAVLKRMRRHYTTAGYEQAVSRIRGVAPDAAITTDVIAGFPGESDAELHIFSFSPRDGTEAAGMPDQVGDRVKKERSRRLLSLGEESAHRFHRRFLGEDMAALFEQGRCGIWTGLTGNYIRVYAESSRDLTNQVITVKLEKLYRDGVWGQSPAT